jgi:exodeoxyribonuclease-3
LVGDFNIAREEIDLARPKDNQKNIMFTPEERRLIDKLVKMGFTDSFRKFHKDETGQYTWWPYFYLARDRNLGWRIDYVFTSKGITEKTKDAFILSQVMGSDHCPVGIEI